MSVITMQIGQWAERIGGWTPVVRAYAAGLTLMVVNVVALAFGAVSWLEQGILVSAMALLTVGLVQEAYAKITSWARHVWVRWAMVPVGAMVVAISLGGASFVVSEATAQDPEYFPRAVHFMAPLAFVPLLALIGVVVLVIALLMMLLTYTLELTLAERGQATEHGWVRLGRLMGTLVAVGILASMIDSSSALGKATQTIAGWAARTLDTHKDLTCGPGKDDRIKRINDELVIRFRTEGGVARFTRERCPLVSQVPYLGDLPNENSSPGIR